MPDTTYYESYETLYENEVEAFLTAAESGDEEAMIELFPASRRADPELRGQISELMAVFPGPVDSREEEFFPAKFSNWDDGFEKMKCDSTFHFVSRGVHYYVDLTCTIVRDRNYEEAGITYVALWSEEAFSEKDREHPEQDGVFVFLEDEEYSMHTANSETIEIPDVSIDGADDEAA